MMVLEYPELVSIPEYIAGEESSGVKHEFIGGLVFAMGGFSNLHNTIAVNCLVFLHSEFRGKAFQAFNSSTKVRIEFPDHTRLYYPDAMVVCQSNPPTDHFQDQPVVVIEVLSDSTRRTDLGEKRDAYLTLPSLKVLMFVEPEKPSVSLHRRKPGGGFAIEHHVGLDAVIPLPEIDAALALADLYDRVEFARIASWRRSLVAAVTPAAVSLNQRNGISPPGSHLPSLESRSGKTPSGSPPSPGGSPDPRG